MKWFRHEYRDKLTGELVGVEVEPKDDLKPHRSEEECDCIPLCQRRSGVLHLIHNAFDGREIDELNHQERGH